MMRSACMPVWDNQLSTASSVSKDSPILPLKFDAFSIEVRKSAHACSHCSSVLNSTLRSHVSSGATRLLSMIVWVLLSADMHDLRVFNLLYQCQYPASGECSVTDCILLMLGVFSHGLSCLSNKENGIVAEAPIAIGFLCNEPLHGLLNHKLSVRGEHQSQSTDEPCAPFLSWNSL